MWLAAEPTQRAIKRRFRRFLASFKDPAGDTVYKHKISTMCAANRQSLEVSFLDLVGGHPALGHWVVEEPTDVLRLFSEAARQAVMAMYPKYSAISEVVHVRLCDLPVPTHIRNLRHIHFNHLVRVTGVVTRRTSIYPQLQVAKYTCGQCGAVIGPFACSQDGRVEVGCCTNCMGKGPFTLNAECAVYRNYQRITLQESPNSVPPGRLPRSREVIFLDDLMDSAKPGDEIDVVGIYKCNFDFAANSSSGFPVFGTVIEANHVSKKEDRFAAFRLTPEDEAAIRKLASEEGVFDKIVSSVAPSIFGHTDIKTAVSLALFGGRAHVLKRKGHHRIRGDINVLLLGDPGTSKSQFLKYVEKTAMRAVYTTGRGSTAVGLTAAVRQDPVAKEWTLEGGALVLADNGVCLIDEFDKMNDQDRTSIYEAMEQQSISISKAGIVTTLQARCSVIAAANPVNGKYDPTLSFAQNIQLTDAILSRFDILLVVRDQINPVADDQLARFVVNSHRVSHPDSEEEPALQATGAIPQELLRKYIVYAKQKHPQWLSTLDTSRLSSMYVDMRRECESGGGIICARHIESTMRLAEAVARMHLRDHVRDSDLNVAIRVMLESFIGTQKYSVASAMRRKFLRYLVFSRHDDDLLCNVLLTMVRERVLEQLDDNTEADGKRQRVVEVTKREFEARAREMDIADCSAFYRGRRFAECNFSVRGDTIVHTRPC
eukprot:TRINITY_DN3069_c0_g1_i2.p1 TRINITY_DN3069_c0_g1~~TRINITY_DN3069_c0_g1_i2.p1  ORF type:complete len:714 (+),score=177.13 TRINITY_DN3069_c0_g1_i2:858-2999(+)